MEFMHLELGQHEVKDNLEDLKDVNRKFHLEYESQKEKVSSYKSYKKYLNKCFKKGWKILIFKILFF